MRKCCAWSTYYCCIRTDRWVVDLHMPHMVLLTIRPISLSFELISRLKLVVLVLAFLFIFNDKIVNYFNLKYENYNLWEAEECAVCSVHVVKRSIHFFFFLRIQKNSCCDLNLKLCERMNTCEMSECYCYRSGYTQKCT